MKIFKKFLDKHILELKEDQPSPIHTLSYIDSDKLSQNLFQKGIISGSFLGVNFWNQTYENNYFFNSILKKGIFLKTILNKIEKCTYVYFDYNSCNYLALFSSTNSKISHLISL